MTWDQINDTQLKWRLQGVFFFLIQSMLCELTHDGPILFYFFFRIKEMQNIVEIDITLDIINLTN